MWFERFVIVVPSLSHEYEPWQWTSYSPTWVDWSILLGSFGWFSMWFLLFIKQFPVIAIAEVKEIVPPRLRTHAATTEIDVSGQHVDYAPETPGEHE
jgi:molybdopterin-containing oxidoreductase family membrane subunit